MVSLLCDTIKNRIQKMKMQLYEHSQLSRVKAKKLNLKRLDYGILVNKVMNCRSVKRQ